MLRAPLEKCNAELSPDNFRLTRICEIEKELKKPTKLKTNTVVKRLKMPRIVYVTVDLGSLSPPLSRSLVLRQAQLALE